jgi:hypothetical protein
MNTRMLGGCETSTNKVLKAKLFLGVSTAAVLAMGVVFAPTSASAFECDNSGAGGTGNDNNQPAATACGTGATVAPANNGGTAVGGSFKGFGAGPTVNGTNGIALGNGSFFDGPVANGNTSIAIGSAIGNDPAGFGAVANGDGSIALGSSVFNTATGKTITSARKRSATDQRDRNRLAGGKNRTNAIAIGTSAPADRLPSARAQPPRKRNRCW